VAKTKGAVTHKIPMEEVEKLASIGATQPEMAAWFGVSLSTIEKRLAQEPNHSALEKGMAKFKLSVRRKQAQLLEDGNVTMAIWLGKQVLGQRDQSSLAHQMLDEHGNPARPGMVIVVDGAAGKPLAGAEPES
jgi:hypothetical protein